MRNSLLMLLGVLILSLFACTPGIQNSNALQAEEPEHKTNPDPGPEPEPTGTPFDNPVIREDFPDPTIWKAGDTYYALATGVGRVIWSSPDLVNWSYSSQRAINEEDTAEAQKYGSHFWAPDMIRIGEYWNLYLTLYNSLHDCGIALFRSTSETGPFSWVGMITHSTTNGGIKDTIDPEVVIDPDSGKVWLFFGSTGKVHRVELTSDGTALAPNAIFTHVAGVDVDTNVDRLKVFEGSYLYKHGNWWYLFASAGLYSDFTYRIVVGRSSSITGEFLNREGKSMKEGYATELMTSRGRDAFYGPGHNAEIFTDSKGQDYILYHCHNKSINGSKDARFLMLQRLFWDEDGWPYFENGKATPSDYSPEFQN